MYGAVSPGGRIQEILIGCRGDKVFISQEYGVSKWGIWQANKWGTTESAHNA